MPFEYFFALFCNSELRLGNLKFDTNFLVFESSKMKLLRVKRLLKYKTCINLNNLKIVLILL